MKTVPVGAGTAPAVVAGMARIGDSSDAQVRALYDAARQLGVNFFDHADIYGHAPHGCETRFAEALALSPAERAEIVLQTKCGIVKDQGMFDFSRDYIVGQVEGSLRALRTDYLDVLLLHRPDALVEPDEVAQAFTDLETSGKVRAFGVSNHTPRQIDLLKTAVTQPLVVNQVQFSITHAGLVAQGVAANRVDTEQSYVTDGGGLIEHARINNITLQAWSPLQSTVAKGVFVGDFRYPKLNAVLDRLAGKYGVTPSGIAIAWITRHPAKLQAVTGTTQAQRLAEAVAGAEVELSRAEWYELFRAAGHQVP